MKQKLDPVLLTALRRLVDSLPGGQSELSRLSRIAQKQISNYLSGKTIAMSENSWERLLPFLSDFLPSEYKKTRALSIAASGNVVSRRLLTERVIESDELDSKTKLVVLKILNGL